MSAAAGKGPVHAILWPALVPLVVLAAGVEPGFMRLVARTDTQSFGAALMIACGFWLIGTLPVLASATLAVLAGQRAHVWPLMGLAALLIAASTFVEIVGIAIGTRFGDPAGTHVVAMVYALSATLLAGAWLMARGWRPVALLVTPVAGVASWFAVPDLVGKLSGLIQQAFGTDSLGVFATLAIADAIWILPICVAVLAAIAWRRTRPATFARPVHAVSADGGASELGD